MTKILKFQYDEGHSASYCRADADTSVIKSLASSHKTCGRLIDDLTVDGRGVNGWVVKISTLKTNQYCTAGYIFDC